MLYRVLTKKSVSFYITAVTIYLVDDAENSVYLFLSKQFLSKYTHKVL